jgi:hypothetical protein
MRVTDLQDCSLQAFHAVSFLHRKQVIPRGEVLSVHMNVVGPNHLRIVITTGGKIIWNGDSIFPVKQRTPNRTSYTLETYSSKPMAEHLVRRAAHAFSPATPLIYVGHSVTYPDSETKGRITIQVKLEDVSPASLTGPTNEEDN